MVIPPPSCLSLHPVHPLSHPSGLPAAGLQGGRRRHHGVREGAGEADHGRGGHTVPHSEGGHGHGATQAGAGDRNEGSSSLRSLFCLNSSLT